MKYNVFFATDAEIDLSDIYNYIKLNDSVSSAKYVIEKIKEQSHKLLHFPKRGHILPEFEKIRNFNYLEVHFKPYRIVYKIVDSNVFVEYILDGRRDLQELLERRLLR